MDDLPNTSVPSGDVEAWAANLLRALRERTSSPLDIAERALIACPGDSRLLALGALAALLENQPERCLVFLKRVRKRYIPDARHHLFHAIALAQLGRRSAAADILKQHRLDGFMAAADCLPVSDRALGNWLWGWLSAIRSARPPVSRALRRSLFKGRSTRAPVSAAKKTAAAKGGRAPVSAAKPTAPARRARPPSRPATAESAPPRAGAAVPDLPAVALDVPLDVEIANAGAIQVDGAASSPEDGAWFDLRAELAQLGLVQGFDELVCLPHLRDVRAYWYQLETVRKVLRQFRGRVLLADEVGLGKTIEAGMVVKEYMLRGMAERVLILTPPSLVGQWQEEMAAKFDIGFATTHSPLLREDAGRFWAQPRVIASIAVARRSEHAARLAERTWDAVIVDEAHHLKNRRTQNYKLVDALQKRFLLLLSATPVQNNLIELFNLLTLLKPGIFRTERDFRAAYMVAGNPRLPANSDRLRDLMRDAMIRNTRATVAVRLPRRHAVTLRVDAGPQEAACYRDLSELARNTRSGTPGQSRLALRHLLGAAGSSPATAASTAGRFAARAGSDPRWQDLHERYRALEAGAKEDALVDLLRRNPAEKKIVFVHYRDTLDRLDALLAERTIAFARFEGAMSGPEKDAAIAAFRDLVPVLLATESGGEGRNLQFCNTLVNFDIPWNPMAIEQRIGRIDRIGQERDVFVFNLATRGTLEDEVLRILDEKINMFELVVGEIGAILGEIDDQEEFAELVFDAWLETTEHDRAAALAGLGARLVAARQSYEGAKQLDDTLFGEDFETA
ncbi:MAG: DEAD/DEAH box helicase [Pseudomonadota bacterium]